MAKNNKVYKIICICQVYNELEKGNLERFIRYIKPVVDEFIIYDDGSTDGSYEYAMNHTSHVIRGFRNEFKNEIKHKQLMLEKVLELGADFILWLDADEVLSAGAKAKLHDLCRYVEENNLDGLKLHQVNLWRSHSWQRIDSLYDIGWFERLWRVKPGISYKTKRAGLHQKQYPVTLRKFGKSDLLSVIHYGFASDKNLAYKYLTYRSYGQRGYTKLDRLINEDKLELHKVPAALFPTGLYVNDPQPQKRSFVESLALVDTYRDQVLRPKYSIFALIYKSVDWLKYTYEQVLRYTDMTDVEFYFVANDADEKVLNYLKDNYIPHYVYNNSAEQRKEWYINNVYRAWNYGAQVARGDFLIFLNSDMGLTPGWLDNLVKYFDGSNCLVSRLVESGKMESGLYGVSKNFGRHVDSYREPDFQAYAQSLAEDKVKESGLYMPVLIRKSHFLGVGGYPEGNIVPGSNIFKPKIAKQGEPVMPGDHVLMEKLKSKNIKHQTSFASIVYHFQEGEMDSYKGKKKKVDVKMIGIVNDLLTGQMGERVLWDYLLESLPSAYGVDKRVVGEESFEQQADQFIKESYPATKLTIQNASFIDTIETEIPTIYFLQDNLRAMKKSSKQQERNLKNAKILVTNSYETALSYPEYDFEVIPIGVDQNLFQPKPKQPLRKKLNIKAKQVGIFVGSFSDVKGWSEIKKCIEHFPQIHWLLVTKDNNDYQSKNVTVYRRVSQKQLVELLNAADFFILGSRVETQALAAIEAALCNIPLIMHNVGIFQQFTQAERDALGFFSDDFIQSIKSIANKKFSPRKIILAKNLTISETIHKWHDLISRELQKQKMLEVRNVHPVPKNIIQRLLSWLHIR